MNPKNICLKPKTINFIDTNEDVRQAVRDLAAFLKVRCECFESGEVFLETLSRVSLGCLITDLQQRNMTGLRLQQELRRRDCKIPVIMMISHPVTHLIVQAMQNGAVTVLELPLSKSELWGSVERALHLCDEQVSAELAQNSIRSLLSRLTPGEKDVLELVLAGKNNKDIAKLLDISIRTVETRRHKLFKKTQTNSVAELVQFVVSASPDCHGSMLTGHA